MTRKQSKLQKTIKYRVLQNDILAFVNNTVELYQECVSFCLQILKKNPQLLESRYPLQAVERLIHKTKQNQSPAYDLDTVSANIPAYFRRAAINSAISTAKSWYSNYRRWINSGKKGRPPTLRPENQQYPVYYREVYKDFGSYTVMIKLYTGRSWVWRKIRVSTTQQLPEGVKELSIKLITKGKRLYIHRTVEKEKPNVQNNSDKIVAVDLNIDRAVVMAVVGRDGRVYKSRFISVKKDNRRRKFYLNTITKKMAITKIIPEEAVFCKNLWTKVKNMNDNLAHNLSRQIVNFAKENHCSLIVFEHLSNLKPDRKSKSSRLNSKLMYWLKGDIYSKTVYKAQWEGIKTVRVNPRNTSKLCSRHHSIFDCYAGGTTRPTQSRFICSVCGYKVDADFNACINIARKFYVKALSGDTEAWSKAIGFLQRCMNPLQSGLGNRSGVDEATPHMSTSYPYLRQAKVT